MVSVVYVAKRHSPNDVGVGHQTKLIVKSEGCKRNVKIKSTFFPIIGKENNQLSVYDAA